MASAWSGLASIASAPLRPLFGVAGAAATASATAAAPSSSATTAETVPLSSLWSGNNGKPVLIYAIRRPGCLLCRDNAASIWARKDDFEKLGCVLTAVVHQALPAEIEAFKPYWGGPLYLDADKALYRALGDGTVRTAGLSGLLNLGVWKRIMAAKKRLNGDGGNTVGDSSVLGGVLLVTGGEKSPRLAYVDIERTFGEFKGVDAYLEEAKKAVGK